LSDENNLITPLKIVVKASEFTKVDLHSRKTVRLEGFNVNPSVQIKSKAMKEYQFPLAI
jgi:hypothetical protein